MRPPIQNASPAANAATVAHDIHLRSFAKSFEDEAWVRPVAISVTVFNAKARSLALWKRLSGSFSRQCETILAYAGGTSWRTVSISGGSSFNTAVIVST